MNLPNKLTTLRFLIAFLIMIFFTFEINSKFLVILVLFIIGAITDALDGYLKINFLKLLHLENLWTP